MRQARADNLQRLEAIEPWIQGVDAASWSPDPVEPVAVLVVVPGRPGRRPGRPNPSGGFTLLPTVSRTVELGTPVAMRIES
jgi:hypothetical protein